MSGFKLKNVEVQPGESRRGDLAVARLHDGTVMRIPVKVIRGKQDGPRLFVSAAIHGDEINGVEIVRRLIKHPALKRLRGTLVAVPIVNVFGFNNRSRYLPDRRDLNRCFPGSQRGSLAARLAHTFVEQIVSKCTHGIDLHTGAIQRTNLPQIRACLDHEATRDLAGVFGAPVVLDTNTPDGSLRDTALSRDIPVLLYEAGEANRFDETSIRIGTAGCLAVMREIGMLPRSTARKKPAETFIAHSSGWTRAPRSGILDFRAKPGDRVSKGDALAYISDPFGERSIAVAARRSGIIIGAVTSPLATQGDALFHIASFEDDAQVADSMDGFDLSMSDSPVL